MESHYSNESAKIVWTGSLAKLDEPMMVADSCVLGAYLEHQAELGGGKFSIERIGIWPAPDNVIGPKKNKC
jgi:hypothetical protein